MIGLQEMLLQGFHQLAFPSGVAGLGCIRVLLDCQVRPGDADNPDQLVADLEDLARSFQKAIPGMQASLQFGPFCLNNVPPISGQKLAACLLLHLGHMCFALANRHAHSRAVSWLGVQYTNGGPDIG